VNREHRLALSFSKKALASNAATAGIQLQSDVEKTLKSGRLGFPAYCNESGMALSLYRVDVERPLFMCLEHQWARKRAVFLKVAAFLHKLCRSPMCLLKQLRSHESLIYRSGIGRPASRAEAKRKIHHSSFWITEKEKQFAAPCFAIFVRNDGNQQWYTEAKYRLNSVNLDDVGSLSHAGYLLVQRRFDCIFLTGTDRLDPLFQRLDLFEQIVERYRLGVQSLR